MHVTSFTQFFNPKQEILMDKEVPYLCLAFGCCDLGKILWPYLQKQLSVLQWIDLLMNCGSFPPLVQKPQLLGNVMSMNWLKLCNTWHYYMWLLQSQNVQNWAGTEIFSTTSLEFRVPSLFSVFSFDTFLQYLLTGSLCYCSCNLWTYIFTCYRHNTSFLAAAGMSSPLVELQHNCISVGSIQAFRSFLGAKVFLAIYKEPAWSILAHLLRAPGHSLPCLLPTCTQWLPRALWLFH